MSDPRSDRTSPLSIGQCATLACLLEVTAPKPGNVYRGADFEDLHYFDFLVSAAAIAPAIQRAAEGASLGETVLAAIRATRDVVATNTNLGTVLLLAPLAMVPRHEPFESGIPRVLSHLNRDDARHVYQAIRLAQPGGLGRVAEADVADYPPDDLLAAMRLASERDLVARQYSDDFAQVVQQVVPWLREGIERGWSLADAIVHAQMRLMSAWPDSLIARKCGLGVAEESARRAAGVLDAGAPGDENYLRALGDLDFWLRCDGHRRNPGTTADLIAAGLFLGLRDGWIQPPYRIDFPCNAPARTS